MEFKVTKASQIFEVNNDMCHNYYWLFYVKFTDGTHKVNMKFVLWDSLEDICEYFDDEEEEEETAGVPKEFAGVTKKQIREYMLERAYATIDAYFRFDTENKTLNDCLDKLKSFRAFCNKTIEEYNR